MPLSQPFQNTVVPSPGFGCMSLSDAKSEEDDQNSLRVLRRAYDLGCRFWDTAVVYGNGHNESVIGRFFKENPGTRKNVFVASKCGFDVDVERQTRGGVTNSPEHIAKMIEGTTQRLGSPPDLYYLHRIDPNTPLEKSIPALQALKAQGKTRFIGLSEPSAETLRDANEIAHIDAVQIEISPWFTEHETNGLIDTAKRYDTTIVAYSPLGKGILTGNISNEAQMAHAVRGDRFSGGNFAHNIQIVDKFRDLAAKKGCTPGQLSIAWVASLGAIPIPGTKKVERLVENYGATGVNLSKEDLSALRKVIDEADIKGERYAPEFRRMVGV